MKIMDFARVQTRPTTKQIVLDVIDTAIQGLLFAAVLTMLIGLYALFA